MARVPSHQSSAADDYQAFAGVHKAQAVAGAVNGQTSTYIVKSGRNPNHSTMTFCYIQLRIVDLQTSGNMS